MEVIVLTMEEPKNSVALALVLSSVTNVKPISVNQVESIYKNINLNDFTFFYLNSSLRIHYRELQLLFLIKTSSLL